MANRLLAYYKKNIFVAWLFFLSACGAGVYSYTPVSNPSDLSAAKMYAYLLPNQEVTNNHWRQEVGPFQFECLLKREGIFQPLFITYYTENDDVILKIRISQDDPYLLPVTPEAIISLDSGYSANGLVEQHKIFEEGNEIYFQDKFGLDIVISSPTLSIDEMIRLTSLLQYIGAKPEDVVIPWSERCQ